MGNQNISTQNKSLPPKQKNNESGICKRRRYFENLGIILTEKCNIKCAHCIFDCNHTSINQLDESTIKNLITQAANIEMIKLIGFTGGEPFLEYDKLVRLVDFTSSIGMMASVITNGFWAESFGEAVKKLERLSNLNNLAVSTDRFHQKFIPVHKVKNVIKACHELSILCYVRISYLNDPAAEIQLINNQLKDVEEYYVLESQPVTPSGRAASQIDAKTLFEYDVKRTPCISPDRPIISSVGTLLACCGPPVNWGCDHPLLLGNIHKQMLSDIIMAANLNPIVHALRVWGPIELLRLVKRQAIKEAIVLDLPASNEFIEMCSLCKFICTNQIYTDLLLKAVNNSKIYREIATARLIELGEIAMMSNL